jgi:Phenazine biosynthesis-like protein
MSVADDLTQPLPSDPGSRVLRYAAFTDQGSGGNPAGVVLDGVLDGQLIQALATEASAATSAKESRQRSWEVGS